MPARPLCGAYAAAQQAASISYAVRRIIRPMARSRVVEMQMAHLLTGDEKYRDSTYGHAYRFASKSGKQTRAKTGLKRLTGFLKTMIEAIADSKIRRMERELELRGIRFDRRNSNWVTRQSQPTERW
jgi:hypothetical protein